MFGRRYFGNRYYGAKFFGHSGAILPNVRGIYLGPHFFGKRYWNQKVSAVDGAYYGNNYFSNRYFGLRFFGSNKKSVPFTLSVTNILAGTGGGGYSNVLITSGVTYSFTQTNSLAGVSFGAINALLNYISEEFYLELPLTLAQASGAGTFSATFSYPQITSGGVGSYFGKRFYGRKYFGKRYWGAKDDYLFSPSTLAGTGAGLLAGNISSAFNVSGVFTSNGVGTFSGAGFGINYQPVITPLTPLAANCTTSLSASIYILGTNSTPVYVWQRVG